MTYARSRLWLGVSGVGFIVVLATASLWFNLPHRLLTGLASTSAIALTLLCFILISSPSDLLGGYFLPRRHHRTQLTPSTFLAAWVRGVLSQALIVGLSALALLQAGRWGGNTAEIACFTLLLFVLLVAQSLVARIVAAFGTNRLSSSTAANLPKVAGSTPLPHTVFHASDPGFVGGWVGFPGAERLIVPSDWLQNLPTDIFAAEMTRRRGVIETGARTRGILIAIAWNVLGFSLACHMPGSSPGDAAGLVQTALWFTLWSFAGLLVLPSLSRPAVLELDKFAVAQGVSTSVMGATIRRLDALQDDEPERSRWIERVFHPIPAVSNRIAALSSAGTGFGGWQCARTTLYLSWACFGFLGRAVHCNAGRPELWVLFPGD